MNDFGDALSPCCTPLSIVKGHPLVRSCIVKDVAEYKLPISFCGRTFCFVSVFSIALVSTRVKSFLVINRSHTFMDLSVKKSSNPCKIKLSNQTFSLNSLAFSCT